MVVTGILDWVWTHRYRLGAAQVQIQTQTQASAFLWTESSLLVGGVPRVTSSLFLSGWMTSVFKGCEGSVALLLSCSSLNARSIAEKVIDAF